jgi:hypothetical protein
MSAWRAIAIAMAVGALLGAAHLASMICSDLTECAVLGDASLLVPGWRPERL